MSMNDGRSARKRGLLIIILLVVTIYLGSVFVNDSTGGNAPPFSDVIRRGAARRQSNLPPVPLDRLPKIALMFLTRGPMPLEPIWKEFLGNNWQSYFSLYVHPAPDFAGYTPESLFDGRVVPNLIATEWGNHSILEAERSLLREALQEPLNTHFVLLSESTVPLYSASTVYTQLISENKSRINACSNPSDPEDARKRMVFRWHPAMTLAGVEKQHWRKSSQWFSLIRKHAERIVEESTLNPIFDKWCYVEEEAAKGSMKGRFCVSDEHYIPTVLAVQGLEGECACDGAATRAVWSGPFLHPKTYGKQDAKLEVLRKELRDEAMCQEGPELDKRSARALAAAVEAKEGEGEETVAMSVDQIVEIIREALHERRASLMKPSCPLFARKIADDALAEWLELLLSISY